MTNTGCVSVLACVYNVVHRLCICRLLDCCSQIRHCKGLGAHSVTTPATVCHFHFCVMSTRDLEYSDGIQIHSVLPSKDCRLQAEAETKNNLIAVTPIFSKLDIHPHTIWPDHFHAMHITLNSGDFKNSCQSMATGQTFHVRPAGSWLLDE